MRFFLLLFFICLLPFGVFTQSKQLNITNETIFKDVNGNVISFDKFLEMTSGPGYKITPTKYDENGNVEEVFILSESVTVFSEPSNFASTPELVGQKPPTFSAIGLDGTPYSLEDLEGRVVVMKFWFAACKPCVDEMPQLNKVVEYYKDNPDVVFLAPSLDKAERLHSFLAKRSFNYQIIPDSRPIATSFNVLGYPTHLIINRLGVVDEVYQGVSHRIEDKLITSIERSLKAQHSDIASTATTSSTPSSPVEDEVMITPNSDIRDEEGEKIPFDRFVQLMRESHYELINQQDASGEAYIMMKKVGSE